MFANFLISLREGLEAALFLWAGAKATGTSTSPLLGAALGLAAAIALGWLVHRGAVRLNLRVFFAWTGLFLVVVAAGVLSYGVHDLQEAGILPGLHALAFDVSATIPPTSWYGTLLKGVFNFSPATTWIQLAAWVAYLVPTASVFVRTTRGTPARAPARPGAGRRPRLTRSPHRELCRPGRIPMPRSALCAAACAALVLPFAAGCVANAPDAPYVGQALFT